MIAKVDPLVPGSWTAAGWAAVAAWLTLTAAVAAFVFAWKQWIEARATRREQTQPFVVVDFEPSAASRSFINLVVSNAGLTLAKNVTLHFTPELESTTGRADGYPPSNASMIRDGIPTMPPGKAFTMFFDSMIDRHDSDLPRRYDVSASFEDSNGRKFVLDYVLDLNTYLGTTYIEEFGAHHAAKALREIGSIIKGWSKRGGLEVWTRDGDERSRREREQMERRMAEARKPADEG